MPLPRLVPNAAQARLDALTTVDLAVFDATLVPSVLATDVDALAGEIDDGVATGYARLTGVAVAWNPTTQRLDLDDPDPVFDLDDALDVTYLVAYDPSDDQVVSFLPFASGPMAGYDGFTVELPDGLAGRGNEWPLQTAIEDHGTRITALENAPPGGGIQSVQAGTNVTVDNTDPANPVVSATGGGGSWGAWVPGASGDVDSRSDGTRAMIRYTAGSVAVDSPALLGAVHADHRPTTPQTSPVMATRSGHPPVMLLLVVDDDAGSFTTTPGGVVLMDDGNGLGGSDFVYPYVDLAGWWL